MVTRCVLVLFWFVGLCCCDALPSLSISRCTTNPIQWNTTSTTSANPFILADCSQPAEQQTLVSACYDDSYLQLHFNCVDNNIYSPYTQCNDHLYNDDVVEVFIAPQLTDDAPIHNYIELELSPNGILFAANVTNPDLTCSGIQDAPFPCNLFQYSATRNDAQDNWYGSISIPWSLLATFPGAGPQIPPASTFRINFFRVDTPKNQAKEYSSWSCDNSNPACFHEPLYFGYLNLL